MGSFGFDFCIDLGNGKCQEIESFLFLSSISSYNMFRRGLFIVLFLICSQLVIAVTPIEPIPITDNIIREEHQKTRDWCQQQWNSKEVQLEEKLEQEKEALEMQMREILWLNRIVSFGSLLIAGFLAFTFRSWLDFRNKKKLWEMDHQESMDKKIGKPPKPIREYGN